jgi:hypothetical protein
MAQTGYTPILLYSSSTTTNAPAVGNLTNSTSGSELAINITDGKLFYKDNANAIQVIAWKTTPTTAGGTGLTTYTAGDLSYYATGTTLTKLAIGTTGQILTSTGSAPQWSTLSGVAVTTFSAGTTGFTPNSATSGAVTLAGTLITSNGGTGLSSYTAGDLSYYASGTALTKLAIGATGRFLSSTGSAPQWSAPAALTEVDDTNVTMTLGGTPSTALLSSVSMTLGWTGTLAVSRGGTGTGTAFTAGSVLFAGASGTYSQDNANFFWDDTNNRLGLGTASPSRQLHIAGAGTSNGIFLVNTAQTSGVDIELGSSDFRFQVRNNIPMLFLTNNTERMRLFASGGVSIGNTTDPGATNLFVTGSVGIGTTIPAVKLDIRGTSGASSTVRIGSDSNDMGTIQFFNTTGSTVNSTISGNLEGGNAGGDLRFATKTTAGSLAEQMRITAAGNVNVVTGNVVIGTSGKGIDFAATPGTGTSELFADYEEGTWNPSLGGTASYNAAEGYYTKVGNLVTAACILYVNTIGTGSTTTITGLPFTARAAPARNSGSVGYFFSLSQNVVFLAPQIAGSGTSVNFQGLTAAGASTADPIAIFGNTAYIMFTITYFT